MIRPRPAPIAARMAISRLRVGGAHEQQIRHVRAGNQQHEADRAASSISSDEPHVARRRRLAQRRDAEALASAGSASGNVATKVTRQPAFEPCSPRTRGCDTCLATARPRMEEMALHRRCRGRAETAVQTSGTSLQDGLRIEVDPTITDDRVHDSTS